MQLGFLFRDYEERFYYFEVSAGIPTRPRTRLTLQSCRRVPILPTPSKHHRYHRTPTIRRILIRRIFDEWCEELPLDDTLADLQVGIAEAC